MEVCAFLLEREPDLEIPNRRGMVPLLSAAKHGHTQVRSLLTGMGYYFLFFLLIQFFGLISLSFPDCGAAAKTRCGYQCHRQAGSHRTDAGCL